MAISLGVEMIPLIAPQFAMHLPHPIHPLIDSGILLASIAAVALNAVFNGTNRYAEADARTSAAASDGAH